MTTNSPDAYGTSSPPELTEIVLHRPHRPINMVAGTIGHFVEWYDWYIYGLLAAVFAPQIFPSDSPFASLIAALLTYAIGFVVRPFSGIIISPLADRYGDGHPHPVRVRDGARLPDHRAHPRVRHDRLRGAHPLRRGPHLQGISAGSEAQSAISFMVEHAPPNRRGLFGSFSNMASGLATLAATGAAAIVTSPSLRTSSPPGAGASRSSSAASSAWSVSSCGPAPTRPKSSRPAPSSTRSRHPHGCWLCSVSTRRP